MGPEGFYARKRLMLPGILLCLLAAVFALEAKIAWFSPSGSSTACISSAKLQAAEAPQLVSKAISRTAPAVHVPEIFAALALIVFAVPDAACISKVSQAPPSALPGCFPSLFFRPPPVR